MMGNVSAKQMGMLHTIYVCMYVCMAIYTYSLTCTTLIIGRNQIPVQHWEISLTGISG